MNHKHYDDSHSDVDDMTNAFIAYRENPNEEKFKQLYEMVRRGTERIVRRQEQLTGHKSTIDDDEYHDAVISKLLLLKDSPKVRPEEFGQFFLTVARNAVRDVTRKLNRRGGEVPTFSDMENPSATRQQIPLNERISTNAENHDDAPRDPLGSTHLDQHVRSCLLKFNRSIIEGFIIKTEAKLSHQKMGALYSNEHNKSTLDWQYRNVWGALKKLPDLQEEVNDDYTDEQIATVRRVLEIAKNVLKQKTPADGMER